ncbi:hypothetical protein KEM56_007751, partial [Ascosphaera pollenicola]
RDQLSQDITLYLPGIAPTLAFASLSVRPLFLSLFEKYLLHLNPGAIRPALKAILLSLLPGLEDETSEDFETALRIVNEFRLLKLDDNGFDGDGTGYFWQTLFLISLTNPGRRAGVLSYLNKYFPRLGGAGSWTIKPTTVDGGNEETETDARAVTQPEPGLLIRCFAAGLTDSQMLIQRGFLDLLVTHIPLHSSLLQDDVTQKDMHVLVSAAISIVTRRDMSLNRRLWSWFLGPEASGNTDKTWDAISSAAHATFDNDSSPSRYFSQYGLKPLVSTIKQMISRHSDTPSERAKPSRISLSLMDRWEIGALIVPEVFLPIMRSAQQYKQDCQSKAQFDEVFRSASAFFDGVESSLIFSELLGLIHVDPSKSKIQPAQVVDDLKLAAFVLKHFNIKEEEMVLVHLPLILFALIHKMKSLSTAIDKYPESSKSSLEALNEATAIVQMILDMLPNRAFANNSRRPSVMSPDVELRDSDKFTIRDGLDFYRRCKESLEPPSQPILPADLSISLLKGMSALVTLALESSDRTIYLKDWVSSFISMIAKAPQSTDIEEDIAQPLYGKIMTHLKTTSENLPFSAISPIVSIATTLYSINSSKSYINYEQLYEIVPLLVHRLWAIISLSSPKYHVEVVRSLWILHSLTWQHHLVQASICQRMVDLKSSFPCHRTSEERAEKFFILWNHSHHSNFDSYIPEFTDSELTTQRDPNELRMEYQLALLDRPLYLVLDLLSVESQEANLLVKEWLKESNSIHNILRVLLLRLKQPAAPPDVAGGHPISADNQISEWASQYRYVLQTLSKVIAASGSAAWSALTNYTVSGQALNSVVKDVPEDQTLQFAIVEVCIAIFVRSTFSEGSPEIRCLQEADLKVLQQLLAGPSAEGLSSFNIDTFVIDELCSAVDRRNEFLQPLLIDTLFVALKIRIAQESAVLAASVNSPNRRKTSLESSKSVTRLSLTSGEKVEKKSIIAPQPPTKLMPCLLKGIRQSTSQVIVQKWISLLVECLPLYSSNIYQVVLTLVSTICERAKTAYHDLQNAFSQNGEVKQDRSEQVAVTLLNGLDSCLAIVHERLMVEEASVPALKTPDQPQSFFGNMVSGVFSSDNSQPRNTTANNRLTVVLCFQDVLRLCFSIWSWGSNNRSGESQQDLDSLASFQYTSLRLRNRARRILEHLFQAEALESLEALIELWHQGMSGNDSNQGKLVLNLLHTLVGSRPKFTVPAVFNAIYTRTNPNALEQNRKSSMSSHLTESDLVAFLVTYARSLDEDVLDEIWTDCTTFLKDVLANPFPHRQILPRLMEFTVILGEKMQHTSFGEDKRAKKELGDLLQRLLTATFTSKPLGSTVEPSTSHNFDESPPTIIGSDDIVSILAAITPGLSVTLSEAERINTAMMSISTNVISPIFHSRLFPQNIHRNLLELLAQTGKVSAGSKHFRKDVFDAFNDPKFFSMRLDFVQSHWLRILNHWALIEKDRLPELLQRIPQPTNAGIMFGVGAAAARLEADRKVQLTLRRLSVLILATEDDNFSADMASIQQKLEDLLNATSVSSPSSVTRAEIFMVMRALVLKTSTIHLAPFWPLIGDELHNALSALTPVLDNSRKGAETYNSYSILQGCKLLETLLLTSPDEFQAQQWLFVNDTIDAVYPPLQGPGNDSAALADHIARILNCDGDDSGSQPTPGSGSSPEHSAASRQSSGGSSGSEPEPVDDGLRHGFLNSPFTREVAKDEIIERIVRPFLERLSIRAFESMYSMRSVDIEGCKDDLLADLFNEFTMAG